MKRTLALILSLILLITGSSALMLQNTHAAAAIEEHTEERSTDLAEDPVESQEDTSSNEFDPAYYDAYREHVLENQSSIAAYDFQAYGQERSVENTRNVVLCDVYGDEVPELLYIGLEPEEGLMEEFWSVYLHILTYEDGSVRELYRGTIDKPFFAGGYFRYYLFQVEGEKSLYKYENSGDDGGIEQYVRFTENEEHVLEEEPLCRIESGGEGSYLHIYVHGQPADRESFDEEGLALQNQICNILMYNTARSQYVADFVAEHGCSALNVNDWLALYSNQPAAE